MQILYLRQIHFETKLMMNVIENPSCSFTSFLSIFNKPFSFIHYTIISRISRLRYPRIIIINKEEEQNEIEPRVNNYEAIVRATISQPRLFPRYIDSSPSPFEPMFLTKWRNTLRARLFLKERERSLNNFIQRLSKITFRFI